jgi:hypothetical protein
MANILSVLQSPIGRLYIEVNRVVLLFGFRWQKTREAFLLPLAPVERRWPFVLVLAFLFVSEFILPMRGWAQAIAPGIFYFTGAHNPLRAPIFREFMPGPGVKVGPVRLHPSLGVAEAFTDNVFRTNTNRRSDYLTIIAPGLQASLPFGGGQHSVLLDYRVGQFLYKNFSENNAFTQDAQGHVSLNFPSGLTMDLQGGRIDGFDPRGSALDIQTRDINKWRIMSLMGQIEFSGPKAGIRLRSSYLDWHFKNNDQAPRRDRKSARADLTLSAKVTPSTSALLGVQIANNTYDTNKQLDSFSYGVFSGFRLAPTRQLSGEFNIGVTILNFDRAPVEQPPDSDLSDGGKQQKFLSMRGNLFWNPTSRLSISASPFRQIRQAGFVGTNTFIQTGINISGRQTLTDRIALRGLFSWRNSDFDSGRNDNYFSWRMGLAYRTVKWLGFHLDYLFEKRNSNEDVANFYSNSAILSIEVFL